MSNYKSSDQIRQEFLDFFEEKNHEIVPSAPLVPHDDPTLLFTNAGMNQFKDVFLGTGSRPYNRAADTQKCLRVSGKHNDLEEVGLDTYHHTLFEMLGNWSFGDYFKREAIGWAWQLLVEQWGLEPDRLYATVHEGDESLGLEPDREAAEFWRTETDINPDHVLFCGSKDNFWMMGDTGPCGPCSEIHIDLRSNEERATTPGRTLVNADDPRVMEIWNLVFIQYNAQSGGHLEPLKAKHVDTGMGFERVVAVLQKKSSNYDTDLFASLFEVLAKASPHTYIKGYDNIDLADENRMEKVRIAMRVVADHIRAVAFSIADGAIPGNEGRGYVIRRILRRAVRYGYQTLGFREPFLYTLIEPLKQKMGRHFPELQQRQVLIEKVVKAEEEGFLRTLETGISLFERYIESVEEGSDRIIPGDVAFQLHDTYGFPIDLTQLMAREVGYSVDMDGYEVHMQAQRDRARAASSFKSVQVATDHADADLDIPETVFVGYEKTKIEDAHILDATQFEVKGETRYQVVLDRTPFYAESGGQVGDTGTLYVGDDVLEVLDTQKQDGVIVHRVDQLPVDPDAPVRAQVDTARREQIKKHHTATHLLHKALRDTLGSHVEQKGSLVAPDRLRFDFSHFERVSPEHLRDLERQINQAIQENDPADIRVGVPIDEAQRQGAMMLFGEKYGDKVRVVRFGDSVELCGGTHVDATGEIGIFRFVSEGSIASGIRRVEALVGEAALDYIQSELEALGRVRSRFKALDQPVEEAVADLLAQARQMDKEITRLKEETLTVRLDGFIQRATDVNGIRVAVGRLDGVDKGIFQNLGETLRSKLGSNAVGVLGSVDTGAGKVSLLVSVSDDLIQKGLKAGAVVKPLAQLVGGGGGGRPTLAMAGGRQPEKLDSTLAQVPEIIQEMLAFA